MEDLDKLAMFISEMIAKYIEEIELEMELDDESNIVDNLHL